MNHKYINKETFEIVDNDNIDDHVISKEICYYKNGKRKGWNVIDKEIKYASDKLLK